MEEQAQSTHGPDGSPGPPKVTRTVRVLLWGIGLLAVVLIAFFLLVPLLAGRARMGTGSYRYARRWRAQLLACQSLDEVKDQFNCFEILAIEGGERWRREVMPAVSGRPQALIQRFPDGRWIACAHADSHGEPGGGTIVSRDSSGEVHVFFGHVCGQIWACGTTLEEFYTELRGYNRVEEKPLHELE